MNEILNMISTTIANEGWIAPIAAILAGILTSFMPCSLSTISLVIGYVGGTETNDTKKAFKLSLVFSIGMAITFTALGIVAGIFGLLFQAVGRWWYILLGILMVLMALQTFEVFTFIKPTYLQSMNKRKGYIGALIAGILGGVFSSPCATPVLVVLLAIVAQSGNVLWGALLLLLYSIGSSILIIICGTSIGLVKKITHNEKYGKISVALKYILGAIILLIGLYMFYLGF